MKLKNTAKYDDIIHLPHHVSDTRPQMSMEDRAAQFSPFAALTGHGDAVREVERLTERRIELDENYKSMIDEKLRMLSEKSRRTWWAEITYFVPDKQKEGGTYKEYSGNVKKIDEYEKQIVMMDGMRIRIDQIVHIEIEEV